MDDSFKRAFRIAACLLTVALGLYLIPRDDGLRHVGHAFGEERDWGDVYKFSQFEVFRDYNPWGGYDLSLRALAKAVMIFPIWRLTGQFALMKLISTAFIAALLWLCISRSKLADAIGDSYSLFAAFIVAAIILAQPILRFSLMRPFAFGTFLLLFCVGREGALKGFASSAIAAFFYPYLAWMYIGPVIVAHWLKGSRSFALGSMTAALISTALQPASFWGMLIELVKSEGVRNRLDDKITEFTPITAHLGMIAVAVVLVFVLFPLLPEKARKLKLEHIIMLIFAPVALMHIRYFLDVHLPLLFVAYGAEIVRAIRVPLFKICESWKVVFAGKSESMPSSFDVKPVSEAQKKRFRILPVVLFAAYGAIAVALLVRVSFQHRDLVRFWDSLKDIPNSSMVLTEFNLQYRTIYSRPDFSVVPSSEIGFPSPEIIKEYIEFMNKGRVCDLANKVGAEFFAEEGSSYLDPLDISCLSLKKQNDKLRIWRIDHKINANEIK